MQVKYATVALHNGLKIDEMPEPILSKMWVLAIENSDLDDTDERNTTPIEVSVSDYKALLSNACSLYKAVANKNASIDEHERRLAYNASRILTGIEASAGVEIRRLEFLTETDHRFDIVVDEINERATFNLGKPVPLGESLQRSSRLRNSKLDLGLIAEEIARTISLRLRSLEGRYVVFDFTVYSKRLKAKQFDDVLGLAKVLIEDYVSEVTISGTEIKVVV